jgi:hypothetical protein
MIITSYQRETGKLIPNTKKAPTVKGAVKKYGDSITIKCNLFLLEVKVKNPKYIFVNLISTPNKQTLPQY